MTTSLNRDQLIALMVAERDAELHGRGAVRPVEWPDAENRLAKAVEFRGVDDVGVDDVGEVVVEHTRIENRVVVASLDSEQSSVSVRVGDESVVLPEDASRAVRSLLRDLATGVPVHVIPADAELTTQQAADLLGLSRTYVVRLIDQGSLSAHMAGTHRRLLASDVLAYRERRASQLAALGELTEADEELGLSY